MGSAEPFLRAMADLFGPAGATPTQSSSVPTSALSAPPNWQSRAADQLGDRQQQLSTSATSFSDTDQRIGGQLASVDQLVRNGKARIQQIQQTYQINSARLQAVKQTPEVVARQAQLDRDAIRAAHEVVTSTTNQMPTVTAHAAVNRKTAGSPDDQIVDDTNNRSDPTIQAASFGTPPQSPQLPQEPAPTPPPNPSDPPVIKIPPRTE
ncbi:hypothetical protein B7435_33655, partial [Mycolicibacterium peregrinum]